MAREIVQEFCDSFPYFDVDEYLFQEALRMDPRRLHPGLDQGLSPGGEEPDQRRLVDDNLGWLRGWLRGRVKDPEVVDDLCQETFLKALGNVSLLKDPSRFSAWLYRIAENTLRDHLRRETRRRKRIQFSGEIEEVESAAAAHRNSPAAAIAAGEQETLAAEESAQLLAAIEELPSRLREPLLLRHSKGLPYAEIARILGISENAVQVRIFRARQRLRHRFEMLEKNP